MMTAQELVPRALQPVTMALTQSMHTKQKSKFAAYGELRRAQANFSPLTLALHKRAPVCK